MSNYYSHPFVSNSDLSKLKKELQTPEIEMELTDAYRMGALVDAMITEPERVYHYDMTMGEYTYSPLEFERAKKMAKNFRDTWGEMLKISTSQAEFYESDIEFEYSGITYCLDMRCKFDLYHPSLGIEIKTTACTTSEQFANTIDRLDYDRAAYLYMRMGKLKRIIIIGISKKSPYNLFPVYITENHPFYISGRVKASELAFKYFMLKS